MTPSEKYTAATSPPSAAALDEGRRRDWDLLAGEYAELFDRYLPRERECVS